MPETLNDDAVRAALGRVVIEAGRSHRYAFPADGLVRFTWDADGDTRGDILGELLRAVAPDVHERVHAAETADRGQPFDSLDSLDLPFTARTADALESARDIQDAGGTWGEALARFDEVYDAASVVVS